VGPELFAELSPFKGDLSSILIVSSAELVQAVPLEAAVASTDIPGLQVLVQPAPGKKCERCWVYAPSVGESAERPTICGRCRDALARSETDGPA
jgi:isoleucyl-tRNA synthetase